MTTSDDVICSSADVTIGCWASARAAPGCDRECFTGHHVGITGGGCGRVYRPVSGSCRCPRSCWTGARWRPPSRCRRAPSSKCCLKSPAG